MTKSRMRARSAESRDDEGIAPVTATCVAWTPAGLAVGTADGVVVFTAAGAASVPVRRRAAKTVAMSADGDVVLVGYAGPTAQLVRRSTESNVALAGRQLLEAGLVSLTRDGTRAIHARVLFDDDGTERTGRVLRYLSAFAANDSVIFSAREIDHLMLHRFDATGSELGVIELDDVPRCLATAAHADACVVGLGTGEAVVVNGGDANVFRVNDFGDEVSCVAMSSDGALIAAGGFVGGTPMPRPGATTPPGRARLFRHGADIGVRLRFARHVVEANGMAFSPDGSRIAIVSPCDDEPRERSGPRSANDPTPSLVRVTSLAEPNVWWELAVGERAAWAVRSHDGRVEGDAVRGFLGATTAGLLAGAVGVTAPATTPPTPRHTPPR